MKWNIKTNQEIILAQNATATIKNHHAAHAKKKVAIWIQIMITAVNVKTNVDAE